MGNFVFKLPDIGEGVVEGEVVQWHVSVGDSVSEDDPIVDVMTDKATVTIPSPVSGVISSLSGDVGDMIAVGSSLMEIESEGEGGGPAADRSHRHRLAAETRDRSVDRQHRGTGSRGHSCSEDR